MTRTTDSRFFSLLPRYRWYPASPDLPLQQDLAHRGYRRGLAGQQLQVVDDTATLVPLLRSTAL